jgi:ankyrin repeat protein
MLKPWGNGREYPEAFAVGKSDLILLLRSGNAEGVRAFLSKEPQWLEYWYHGESLLHFAAEYDYPAVLAVLVKLGLDVNTPKQNYPWGALATAVERDHLSSTRWLLEHGAKTTYAHRGLTFCCGTLWSVASGNFEMVTLLVDHGAPVDILVDDPPRGLLTAAIAHGHTKIADYLRSKGALTDEEIKRRAKGTTKPRKGKK